MAGLTDVEKSAANRPTQEMLPTNETDFINVKAGLATQGHSQTISLTATFVNQTDAPHCPSCGSMTVRNGACYKCLNCGESLGCS